MPRAASREPTFTPIALKNFKKFRGKIFDVLIATKKCLLPPIAANIG
jgi:hypothetical protein